MNNILKYQTLDLEMDRLIKQQNSYEELKVIERMKNIVKNAQNNSINLESEAEKLLSEYSKLKSDYDKQFKKINTLTHMDINKMTREEINNNLMSINSISSELFMIERNLNIVINNISKALRDFENNKKTAIFGVMPPEQTGIALFNAESFCDHPGFDIFTNNVRIILSVKLFLLYILKISRSLLHFCKKTVIM